MTASEVDVSFFSLSWLDTGLASLDDLLVIVDVLICSLEVLVRVYEGVHSYIRIKISIWDN